MNPVQSRSEQDARWTQWQAKNRARDAEAAERRRRTFSFLVAALLVGVLVFWSAASERHLLIRGAVTAGAVAAAARSFMLGDFMWVALFGVAAAAWNPITPTFTLAGPMAVGAVIATALLFCVSAATWTPAIAPLKAGAR